MAPEDPAQGEPAPGALTDALAAAVAAGDVATALRLLRPAQLVVPVTEAAGTRTEGPRWPTVQGVDRPFVVVFSSWEAMTAVTGQDRSWGTVTSLPELAAAWPDPSWGLAVDPGLPGHLTLEAGTVARLAAPSLGDQVAAEPALSHPLVQAVLPVADVDPRLDRGEGRFSGYVHQVHDVLHIATPTGLLRALGRAGEAADLVSERGSVFLLRWPVVGHDLYRSAYGGRDDAARDAVAGWIVEPAPFVGLGFSPQPDALVREHRVHGVELPHDAQLFELGEDGREHRWGTWDGDRGTWLLTPPRPVEVPS